MAALATAISYVYQGLKIRQIRAYLDDVPWKQYLLTHNSSLAHFLFVKILVGNCPCSRKGCIQKSKMGALPFVMVDAGRCPLPIVYAECPQTGGLLSANDHM